MYRKRVLVIGGGFGGVGSIAQLKAEGLEPVCYEKTDNYGGTWCYRKESVIGQSSIMPTTIINHSKEMGAVSNFPPKKELSNYMKHSELYQYVTDYMKQNDCKKYIKFKMEVLHVKKAEDYEETGKWSATTKDLTTGEILRETFDGVFVATGCVNRPNIPKFPGQDNFTGEILHTHSLKEVEYFADKRVVVVGIGNSALDAAVEISRVAKQVYLSTRSGAFIWSRVAKNGCPIDYILLRRYLTFFLDILPVNLCSWYLETFYLDTNFDHRLYYVKPKYHVLCHDPVLNDHIGMKLLSGLVIQKGNIKKFEETGVYFEGEETLTEIDAVIMATGYSWRFPFLDDGIVKEENGMIHLYKCIYPPHLPHATLAVIGFAYPYGPGFPLGEMQIRWAAYLLAGKGKLPSEDTMMKDIIKLHKENEKRYKPRERSPIRVDFVQYMDGIAEQMGVKPNLLKYLFTDFPLFLRLLFGPCLAYQYRLEGHGKWKGAREAIMTVEERIQWPLRRKPAVRKELLEYIMDYIVNLVPLNVYVWH